jgi:hypothetical protein
MKKQYPILIGLLGLFILMAVQTVRGNADSIIIERADASNTLSIVFSPDLDTLVSRVEPRFVMEFANANEVYDLTPIPTQLDTLLGQIAPRFVLQFANANRELALAFPVDLIDDTAPPQGTSIEAKPTGDTRTTVSWTTDEYADSTVECGTQSGTYTMTFSDPLYVKVHAVTVTGLTPGTTYYCQVSSTDLSGNTYQSEEFTFEQKDERFIYLPLVLRQ